MTILILCTQGNATKGEIDVNKNIKAGDKIYYRWMVQNGFSSLPFWEIVMVTRTTKTLIIVGDMRFKKTGVDLYEINEKTKREAERDNRIVRHSRLCREFWNYKWDKVGLEKLLQIETILNG